MTNYVKKYCLIHERTSFGVDVYSKSGADDADVMYIAKCSRCGRWVKMNGPGSDANIFTRAVKALLWCVKRDTQELFTPAADLHDMQCHQGLTDEELERANKQFRENCFRLINERYDSLMKALSRDLSGKPSVSWFEALFSSEKRDLWRKQRNLRELIDERKDKERDAELYYTALKIASRSVVRSVPCDDASRQHEDDCFYLK